jgi:hypothetical protein
VPSVYASCRCHCPSPPNSRRPYWPDGGKGRPLCGVPETTRTDQDRHRLVRIDQPLCQSGRACHGLRTRAQPCVALATTSRRRPVTQHQLRRLENRYSTTRRCQFGNGAIWCRNDPIAGPLPCAGLGRVEHFSDRGLCVERAGDDHSSPARTPTAPSGKLHAPHQSELAPQLGGLKPVEPAMQPSDCRYRAAPVVVRALFGAGIPARVGQELRDFLHMKLADP